MKSAMKAMKAVKAMKAMKAKAAVMKKAMKKAMKVSTIAKGKRAKSSVFKGTKAKTSGGLSKDDLTRNKAGKVVQSGPSCTQGTRCKGICRGEEGHCALQQ